MENTHITAEQIASRLKQIISEKKISQAKLASLCGVSQGTISNALSKPNSMSLNTLLKLCAGLNLSVANILADSPIPFVEGDNSSFILDANDTAYSGYLDDFYIYFLPTVSNASIDYVRGNLNFQKDPYTKRCLASLHINTGDKKNNEPVIKEYNGSLIISKIQRCAYCYLYSNLLGEICLLIFNHDYLNTKPLYCTLANALTSSAGRYRHPTVHRICLSREEIDDTVMRHLMGELLLINDKFFISEKKYKEFISSPIPHSEFKEMMDAVIKRRKNDYYLLSESDFRTSFSDTEFSHNISFLKSFSEASANSKITPSMEDQLFALLKAKQNKSTDF